MLVNGRWSTLGPRTRRSLTGNGQRTMAFLLTWMVALARSGGCFVIRPLTQLTTRPTIQAALATQRNNQPTPGMRSSQIMVVRGRSMAFA